MAGTNEETYLLGEENPDLNSKKSSGWLFVEISKTAKISGHTEKVC